MHNPKSSVAPCSKVGVLMVVAKQSQGNGDGIEDLRLFMQVIVVVSNAANLNGDLGIHFLINGLLVGANVVFGNGRKTCCVHPDLCNLSNCTITRVQKKYVYKLTSCTNVHPANTTSGLRSLVRSRPTATEAMVEI